MSRKALKNKPEQPGTSLRMHLQHSHPWNVSSRQAVAIQESLRARLVFHGLPGNIRYTAGTDVSCSVRDTKAWAGVAILAFPELQPVSFLVQKGKNVGAVLRTRTHVKPVFVSPGYAIILHESVRIILQRGRGYRIPEPVRQAHLLVNRLRQEQAAA